MPRLLEEVQIKLDRLDLHKRLRLSRLSTGKGLLQVAERSKGVHVSGILKPLAVAAKQLKPGEVLEEELPVLWALGIAWEEFVCSLYPDMDYQPGELCRDGVWMTCDGINMLPHIGILASNDTWEDVAAIEECKLTFKKEKQGKDFLSEWMWMHQGRAYCAGYGPLLVRWHVCYLRGDYKVFGPTYWRYLVEFSEREVETTWNMLVANKGLAVPE